MPAVVAENQFCSASVVARMTNAKIYITLQRKWNIFYLDETLNLKTQLTADERR
jgi:hypothetical protein